MRRFSLALALFGVLALLAGSARAEEKKAEPKKVKFDTLKTQHIVVEAKLNGKGPFRLIFDTGAPLMLINNKLAKEAGVIDKDKPLGAELVDGGSDKRRLRDGLWRARRCRAQANSRQQQQHHRRA